ncbi:hypothetical protein OUZ56_027672 [Daphnia magna]|uniref:Uncharacterized protein n=1 Tax=Daphnia magna TaxID=35525 RepID=A0ABR0B1L0_9CRUS|nr:hypothetical protein OUZ56_027672 [Daphnia magna]
MIHDGLILHCTGSCMCHLISNSWCWLDGVLRGLLCLLYIKGRLKEAPGNKTPVFHQVCGELVKAQEVLLYQQLMVVINAALTFRCCGFAVERFCQQLIV